MELQGDRAASNAKVRIPLTAKELLDEKNT